MGRKRMSTEDFITRAKQMHGNQYDYTDSIFERTDKPFVFNCSIHGTVKQVASNHLKGNGCKQCSVDKQRKTLQRFISTANTVHGNKYYYVNTCYVNDKTKVEILCSDHGAFHQKPNKHLSGNGCPRCANKYQTTYDFIRKSINRHGEVYDYTHSKYVNDNTKIRITCKRHGPFLQAPSNHHSLGQGCPNCKLEKAKNNIGYYNQQLFDTHPNIKNDPAIFYVIRCQTRYESFYKVGITQQDIEKRFYGIPYNISIEQEVHTTLYEAFCREQVFLKRNDIQKYKPKKYFHGWTECFII